MKIRHLLFIIFSLLVQIGFAQTAFTNYTIDYSYKTINNNCNVFSSSTTIDNYIHQTTIGFPTFTGSSDYYINLPCKRNSFSSQNGTEYQIVFPFKKGYKYQINVNYKGTVSSSGEAYPQVALSLNTKKKPQNTSTSCGGAQSVAQNYWGYAASGSGLAWSKNPIINTQELTENYESLSIASFPWPGSSNASGNQSIQVRKVLITEFPPPPPPPPPPTYPPPPTSNFEGKFYLNPVTGNKFVGIRGSYRIINPASSSVFTSNANFQYTLIGQDPIASSVTNIFPSIAYLPMSSGWDDPNYVSSCYLKETSTGKWYLGEFTYRDLNNNDLSSPLQLNLIELDNIALSQYHLKSVEGTAAMSNWYGSDGIGHPILSPITVNTLVTNDTIYLWDLLPAPQYVYNKLIYLNKLPNLTGQ